MMLSVINKICPKTFLQLTKDYLEKNADAWNQAYRNLQHTSTYQGNLSPREEEERLALREWVHILPELIEHASPWPQPIYTLYSLCESIDPLKRVKAWFDYLVEECKEETYILPVLFHLGMNTPLQFAGSLLYLLWKKTSVETLLETGYFHAFFALFGQHEAKKTVDILHEITAFPEQSLLTELLDKLGGISCEEVTQSFHLKLTALNGIHYPPTHILKRIKANYPKLAFTDNPKNINALYQLFGEEFFFSALYFFSCHQTKSLRNFLTSKIAKMTEEDLIALYQAIRKNHAREERLHFLRGLDELLSESALTPLLASEMAWFILGANPSRISLLTDNGLRTLVKKGINATEIRFVEIACKELRFAPYLNDLFFQMFNIIINNPHILIKEADEDDLVKLLNRYRKTKEWSQPHVLKLKTDLHDEIAKHIPFNNEAYKNIQTFYLAQEEKIQTLSLFNQDLEYPNTTHRFHAFILHELYHVDPHFNLINSMDEMFKEDYTRYDELAIERIKIRTLYECIARDTEKERQAEFIHVLVTTFQHQNWIEFNINGHTLLTSAIIRDNVNLLVNFCTEIPDQTEKIRRIHKVNLELAKRRKPNFLRYVLINAPCLILHLVDAFPIEEVVEGLKEPINGQNSVCSLLDDDKALGALLYKIPKHFRLSLLTPTDKGTNSPFDLALNHPKALTVLMSSLNHFERLSLVSQLYEGKTLLQKSLNHPQALSILLNHLLPEDRLTAINERGAEHHLLLHLIAHNPILLNTVLTSLPLDLRSIAVNLQDKNGYTVLHKAIHNAKALATILMTLPEDKRLTSILIKNDFGHTALHLCAGDPQAIELILGTLLHEHVLKAIIYPNGSGDTLLHLAKMNPKVIKVILNGLSPSEQIHALNAVNFFKISALNMAREYPASLEAILVSLPLKMRYQFIHMKTPHHQSLIEWAKPKPELFQCIYNALPAEDQKQLDSELNDHLLINHSFFKKATDTAFTPAQLSIDARFFRH